MADPNISNILAALAAQHSGGTPSQMPPQPMPGAPYPPQYGTGPPGGAPSYALPQPISSGSVDLSSIKPVSSGSVSIADAIAKARGFAAEKGVAYDAARGSPRNPDLRMSGRSYRRSRSPSRTPPRAVRESFRDNYNPYRDERRGANDRGYTRDRTLSPRPAGRFSPPGAQGYPTQVPRSPPGRGRGGAGGGGGGGEGDTETIPIEKSLVGLIIGRSGENLRRVESTTGARVQFMDGPESGGSTRHCKISGSRTARAAAKAEIYRIIDENGNGNRGGSQDYARAQTKAPSSTGSKDGENTQIMVPDRTVGLIIGRGGETIRDLQERSGCHVNIVGENKSINGLRPVNLIGSLVAQQRARDLILEIVESDTKNMAGKGPDMGRHPGRDDPYASGQDKMNDSVMVPGDAVGMIIGKGGESIKEMQNSTGCKINVSPASGRDIEREIGLVGTRQAIDLAKRAIMEKVDAVEQRNRGQGKDGRDDDRYDTKYPPQQQGQAPAYPYNGAVQAQQPQTVGGEDPYAAYGGYNNYVAMWYAAMAQQQQQQGGPGQANPPGGS